MGKRGAQALDRNPNWKGGRTTTEHGYVLVKRPDHPRADSRGYVYEHILVAEQMIGRPLNPGEEVHHDDLHRSNNVPSHLKVKTNHAWHFLEHRKPESKLRLPDEDNTRIVCGCGCGQTLWRYDSAGRPRVYIHGHNASLAPLQHDILRLLSDRPAHYTTLARTLGKKLSNVQTVLGRMVRDGMLVRVSRGVYARQENQCV